MDTVFFVFHFAKGTLPASERLNFLQDSKIVAEKTLGINKKQVLPILREVELEDCCDNIKNGLLTLYAYVGHHPREHKEHFVREMNALFNTYAGYRGLYRNTIIIKEHTNQNIG